MVSRFKQVSAVILSLALLFLAVPVNAQALQSATATVTLNLTVAETLTVSTGATTSVNFAPTTGFNYATPAIPVTTTYSLLTSRTSLNVCEYFISNSLPLDGAPNAGVAYKSSINGGAGLTFNAGSTACNSAFGVAGYVGQDVFDATLTPSTTIGSHNDSVVVSTNFTSGVAPGSYSGSIVFAALAN